MSRLLLNAINNSFKGNILESIGQTTGAEMPVNVGDPGWELKSDHEKNFLFRSYTIDDPKLLSYFLDEILALSRECNHHPMIYIFNNQIDIKLFTMNMNDVSDIDVKMSKNIDDIIEDIQVIRLGKY